jgi:hypothetical protein
MRSEIIGRTHGIVRGTGRGFDVAIMLLWGFQDRLAVRLEIVIDVPTMQAALEPQHKVRSEVPLADRSTISRICHA